MDGVVSARMRWPMVVMAVAALGACRDEQAGPRPKAPRAPPPAGQPPPAPALDSAPGELTWKSGATWGGGAVQYLGSKVEPAHPQAGQPVMVQHYFTAVKPPPPGYQFFMHAIDANSGRMLANMDESFGGAPPLASWPVGKVVALTHQFAMPTYEGTVQLVMGFWNDQGRLAVDDPKQQDGQSRVFGPKLEGGGQAAQAPGLPEYHAPRAAKPPTIDGRLDDAVWQAAPAQVLVGSYDGRPVSRKTTFKVTWDDKNLYLAFDCEDPDVWGTLRKHDEAIYNEEVVGAFIDADGDGKTYNELELSPHNVTFDAAFVTRRSDLPKAIEWESGMVTAVQINGTLDDDKPDVGWTAEMEIPLEHLSNVPHLPPQKGDRWRFNAYRLEHLQRGKQIEGQAFSPLFQGDFHNLPRFGWLVFE